MQTQAGKTTTKKNQGTGEIYKKKETVKNNKNKNTERKKGKRKHQNEKCDGKIGEKYI